MHILHASDYQLLNKREAGSFNVERVLRCYSGGSTSGSSNQKSSGSSSGSGTTASTSSSAAQLTPAQVLSLYGSALPNMANATNTATNNSIAAPATNAAVQGATKAVNAINLTGLSPGEAAATERSSNQTNTGTGNLGLDNPTNTVANAMNFGGAFNNKISLLNNAVNTASGAANAANNTTSTTASLFNPVSSSANTVNSQSKSNSLFNNSSASSGTGNSQNSGFSMGCFLTTACCEFKGLPDDCEELTILRAFRDAHVPEDTVKEYYRVAPLIVEKIKGNETVLTYIWDTIKACINYIKEQNPEYAMYRYKLMVVTLKNLYHVK